ncbi:uncharacterized protein LOC117542572 [Gymnodraco acuticeps]|uniref:Uncharacterized protein LOC117542572 n=1 Tax=Gymnodraco acuticeps TaxID=8218 RepID=A0A6P8UJG7_GYMAC|nr:uncharacterized protein LOC117542572 [Gymnodraco acuticeps]
MDSLMSCVWEETLHQERGEGRAVWPQEQRQQEEKPALQQPEGPRLLAPTVPGGAEEGEGGEHVTSSQTGNLVSYIMKQQQAKLAKKNAQRTVRRTQFRSHHCLPRQTKSPRKPASVKDDSFFRAFQGLSLDELLGSSRSSAAAGGGGDQCKVMSHLTARQSNGPQETERTDSSRRKGRGSHLNPGRGDKANIFVCLCFFQLILIVHDGCFALNSVATCENGIY